MIGLVVIVIQMLFFTIVLINYFFAPVLSLPKQALKASNKSVAVLIPVRNEEEHIKDLLDDLFAQSRLPEEIIIYNDGSVDNTKLIVESYIENYPHILRMIEGGELPKGWLGKAHACYHLGNAANADYLLFLDADVRLHACAVATILDQMVKYNWTLLSAFPKQIMKTWGEKIVVPIMNIVLLSLLPLPLIRIKRFSSLSAANGQMMCFDRSVYIANQFHALVKQEKAEDIAIARTMKRLKLRVMCYLGGEVISCRMYQDLKSSIDGFSKNLVLFFGGSVFAALLYWSLFLMAPLYFLYDLFLFVSLVLIQGMLLFFIAVKSRGNVEDYLLYSIPRIFLFIYILGKGLFCRYSKRLLWKDRNIM